MSSLFRVLKSVELFFLSFFTFQSLYFSFLKLTRFVFRTCQFFTIIVMLCTYLLLFNCQGSIASELLRRKLCYYITFFSTCQYLFEKFFKFFSWFLTSRFSVIAVCFAHNSLIISHSIPFVNTFLKSFLKSFFKPLLPLSTIDRDVCFISSYAVSNTA